MAYTPFAVLLALVMVSFASNPPMASEMDLYPVKERYSLESSVEQTQQSYALKSIQNLANISKNQDVTNFNSSVKELYVNGSYGTNNQLKNMESLQTQYESSSGTLKHLKLDKISLSVSNLTLRTNTEIMLGLDRYNTTTRASHYSEINSVDDPLLENIGYEAEINSCPYEKLAEKHSTSDYNGTARGEYVVDPSDISTIPEKDRKILVSADITTYDSSDVQDYAGYISETDPSSPGDYNINHATGLTLPSLENQQRIVIHQGMWTSNIHRTIKNHCYLKTSQISTPSIPDRIENKTRGNSNEGVYTLVNTTKTGKDSDKSNIGYERVDKPSELVNITGVTQTDGIEWEYFRMNKSTAEYSGLEQLIQ